MTRKTETKLTQNSTGKKKKKTVCATRHVFLSCCDVLLSTDTEMNF